MYCVGSVSATLNWSRCRETTESFAALGEGALAGTAEVFPWLALSLLPFPPQPYRHVHPPPAHPPTRAGGAASSAPPAPSLDAHRYIENAQYVKGVRKLKAEEIEAIDLIEEIGLAIGHEYLQMPGQVPPAVPLPNKI